MRGQLAASGRSRPARASPGRPRSGRCGGCAHAGRAERGHQPGEQALPARRREEIAEAVGERAHARARSGRTGRPAAGSMSTTMIRPARSGRRAAIIIASVPPIEWPTIAGRLSPRDDDVAGELVGQRRDDRARAHCRAPARRRSPRPGPDGSDSRAPRRRSPRQVSRPAVRPGIRITSGPRPTHLDREAGRLEALRGGAGAPVAGERQRSAQYEMRRFIALLLGGQV